MLHPQLLTHLVFNLAAFWASASSSDLVKSSSSRSIRTLAIITTLWWRSWTPLPQKHIQYFFLSSPHPFGSLLQDSGLRGIPNKQQFPIGCSHALHDTRAFSRLFLDCAGEKRCFSYPGEQEMETPFSALPSSVVSNCWFTHSASLVPFASAWVYSLFLPPLSVPHNSPRRRLMLSGWDGAVTYLQRGVRWPAAVTQSTRSCFKKIFLHDITIQKSFPVLLLFSAQGNRTVFSSAASSASHSC